VLSAPLLLDADLDEPTTFLAENDDARACEGTLLATVSELPASRENGLRLTRIGVMSQRRERQDGRSRLFLLGYLIGQVREQPLGVLVVNVERDTRSQPIIEVSHRREIVAIRLLIAAREQIEETATERLRLLFRRYRYRKIYFLRRSIATLVEFASAIEMLDQRPEFRARKTRFDREVQERWDNAAKYFRDWKTFLSERRADFGGHFDHGSALHAVKEMHPDTVGKIVVVKHTTDEKGGVRLAYAMEIVGAAMTHRKPDDQGDREWFHEMFVVVRAGSNEAVKAVHALSIMHLLEKIRPRHELR
jgi:hypothetical protein